MTFISFISNSQQFVGSRSLYWLSKHNVCQSFVHYIYTTLALSGTGKVRAEILSLHLDHVNGYCSLYDLISGMC